MNNPVPPNATINDYPQAEKSFNPKKVMNSSSYSQGYEQILNLHDKAWEKKIKFFTLALWKANLTIKEYEKNENKPAGTFNKTKTKEDQNFGTYDISPEIMVISIIYKFYYNYGNFF